MENRNNTWWGELKNLVGDYVSYNLSMWTPYKDNKDEHTYLYPYRASASVAISSENKLFTLNYIRPAEEGMDGKNDIFYYDIKSIQVDKKTQSKFVFRVRIADDRYQKFDLFFAFEYDQDNKKVIKAASCNTKGFGVIKPEDIVNVGKKKIE